MLFAMPPQPPMFHEATKTVFTRAAQISEGLYVTYLYKGQLLIHIRFVTKDSMKEFPVSQAPSRIHSFKDSGNNVYDLFFQVSAGKKLFWRDIEVTQPLDQDLELLQNFRLKRQW